MKQEDLKTMFSPGMQATIFYVKVLSLTEMLFTTERDIILHDLELNCLLNILVAFFELRNKT